MKLYSFVVLFAITFVKYSSCDEYTLSPEEQHDDECKILIQAVYQQSCTKPMNAKNMAPALFGFQVGNDSKAIEYCRLVAEGANCVLNNFSTKTPDDCKTLEEYQSKIAIAKHDKTYSEYFCANNMQHLRDHSELDGIICLYGNDFRHCKYHTHATYNRFTKKEKFCRDYYVDRECSAHWGICQNKKVRDIELQLLDVMLQGMDCPPQS